MKMQNKDQKNYLLSHYSQFSITNSYLTADKIRVSNINCSFCSGTAFYLE